MLPYAACARGEDESEPDFWDAGGFYQPLSVPTAAVASTAAWGVAGGVGAGMVAGALNRARRNKARSLHEPVTVDDLGEKS